MGNCIQSKSNEPLTINMMTLYMIEPQHNSVYVNDEITVDNLIQISLTQLKIHDNSSVKLIFSDEEQNRNLLLKDIGICNEAQYKIEYSKHSKLSEAPQKNIVMNYSIFENKNSRRRSKRKSRKRKSRRKSSRRSRRSKRKSRKSRRRKSKRSWKKRSRRKSRKSSRRSKRRSKRKSKKSRISRNKNSLYCIIS